MTTYGLIMCVPMVALLAWAAVSDWSARRIPNWLTFSLALTGLLQSTTTDAAVGFRGAGLGLLVGFCLTFTYFALGAMCGGDVKLMAAVGAWLGPLGAFQVFLAEALIGAALALVQAVVQGRLRTVLQNTVVLAGSMAAGAGDGGLTTIGALESAAADAPVDKRWLPYSVPVLIATVVVLALRWNP